MWRCKRKDIEVFWNSQESKFQKKGEKHFPVCNRWNNGRCLEDSKPCEKGGKNNIEKISD